MRERERREQREAADGNSSFLSAGAPAPEGGDSADGGDPSRGRDSGTGGDRPSDRPQQFEELIAAAYDKYRTSWCSYARTLLWWNDPAFGPRDLVNQAVQATLGARPTFTSAGKVNAYVRKAIRTIKGRWLTKCLPQIVGMISLDGEESQLEPPGVGPLPDHEAFLHERAEELRELLVGRTRPIEREAFILREFYGWDVADIAKHQGVRRETASRRIGKVRKLLKPHLKFWASE